MRTYENALSLVGQKVAASDTGGRRKLVHFEDRGTDANGRAIVGARLFQTDVATFTPEGVELRTGGYVTPSTFDGIATALNRPRVEFGTRKRVPYAFGYRMTEGMLFGYADSEYGRPEILHDGPTLTPDGPGRN